MIEYDLEEINDIQIQDCSEIMYDIEVEEDHSYIANDYVVHNSGCETRVVAGIGYPQLSCIIECSNSAHGININGINGAICSDGGIRIPADLVKALAANADFVMCGGILSAHDESGGDVIEENGKKYKLFYGMSSSAAMNKYNGGVAKYRSSEGRVLKLEYRGPVIDTLLYYQGGVRSAMTYVGARILKHLSKCTTFVRVSDTNNKVYDSHKIGN